MRFVRGSGLLGGTLAFAVSAITACGGNEPVRAPDKPPEDKSAAAKPDVRNAVTAGFRYMEATTVESESASRRCFSCHHSSETLEVQLLGTRMGVPSSALNQRFCGVVADLREQGEASSGPKVVGNNQFAAQGAVTIKALLFLDAFNAPYDANVGTMIDFTLAVQEQDGSFGGGPRKPPKVASRVADVFDISEGWLQRMPANEPKRKKLTAAVTRAAKFLPTFDTSSVPENAPYDDAGQLRGLYWLKRQASAANKIVEEPIDVAAVDRKAAAVVASITAKAKKTSTGTCWEWSLPVREGSAPSSSPPQCDAYVTASNVLALQATNTAPELLRDGVRWLVAAQDPKTGKWASTTHTEVQMAADLFVLDGAFNPAQHTLIQAAHDRDKQSKQQGHNEVRKLVRSSPELQMALRNEIQSSMASGLAMRALVAELDPKAVASARTSAPPTCPPTTTKKERPGSCMRCHSQGGEAPIVLPFQPENLTAWEEALAKPETKKATLALAQQVLERISLPPDDINAMPPADSPESSLFHIENVGVRKRMLAATLKKALAADAGPPKTPPGAAKGAGGPKPGGSAQPAQPKDSTPKKPAPPAQ